MSLLSGDLLNLHVQSEAEKFLKPWWDVVIDYLVLVLVLIAVVCGVAGLYASGPVCMPVLRCPPQENSSSLKKITCAMIHNSSRNGEDPLDILVKFTNRNMFDYVNSECRKSIFCLVRVFPNILLTIAGYCVVCSNAWFVLKSPILEQLSDLLQDCYKHASVISNPTSPTSEGASTSQLRTALLPTTPPQHATPTEFCCYRSTGTEDRNRVKKKLERFVNDFKQNDTTNCPCCPHSWSSISKSYIIITLFFQTAVAISIFITLVWLMMGDRMNRQYECNIDEIIPDLVYDNFACTYSIAEVYFLCALAFSTIVGAYTGFSCLKLVSAIKPRWLLKTSQLTRINEMEIESCDLKFLLKLVALSNSAYLDPFCEMHKKMNNDN